MRELWTRDWSLDAGRDQARVQSSAARVHRERRDPYGAGSTEGLGMTHGCGAPSQQGSM